MEDVEITEGFDYKLRIEKESHLNEMWFEDLKIWRIFENLIGTNEEEIDEIHEVMKADESSRDEFDGF